MAMKHISLTCRNHPQLRWRVKECAWTNGRYNGSRNIHYCGKIGAVRSDPFVEECACDVSDLYEV